MLYKLINWFQGNKPVPKHFPLLSDAEMDKRELSFDGRFTTDGKVFIQRNGIKIGTIKSSIAGFEVELDTFSGQKPIQYILDVFTWEEVQDWVKKNWREISSQYNHVWAKK